MRPPVSRSALLALLALLCPLGLVLTASHAHAWPVDLSVRLEPGKERFHKLSVVDWVEVEDPSLATAEVLTGSNELLLTGLKPGHTLLLLYAEGRFAVWGLTVAPAGSPDAPPPEALLTAARKACPGLQATQGAERSLTASVKDARCHQALLALFKTETYVARELDLTLELPVLQEQLSALAPALAKVAIHVGPPEYFAVLVAALVLAGGLVIAPYAGAATTSPPRLSTPAVVAMISFLRMRAPRPQPDRPAATAASAVFLGHTWHRPEVSL